MFEASKAEAKALFLKMLRLEGLAEISAAAAERRKGAEDTLAVTRTTLVPSRAAAARAATLRAGIRVAEEEARATANMAILARQHLDALAAEHQRVQLEVAGLRQAHQNRADQRRQLAAAIAAAEADLAAAHDRLVSLDSVVGQADAIRDAYARHTDAATTAAAVDAERERFALDMERMRAEAAAGQRWATELRGRLDAAQACVQAAEQAKNRLTLLSDEQEALTRASAERERLAAVVAETRDELATLRIEQAGLVGRRDALDGHDRLAGVDLAVAMCGACPLTAQAREAGATLVLIRERLDELDVAIAGLEAVERTRQAELAESEQAVARCSAAVAHFRDVEALARTLPDRRSQVRELDAQRLRAEAEATNREAAMGVAAGEIASRCDTLAVLRERIAADAPLAAQYSTLALAIEQQAAAAADATRLGDQLSRLRADHAGVAESASEAAQLTALDNQLEELAIERQAADTQSAEAARLEREAADRLARLNGELVGISEQAEQVEALERGEAAQALAVDDWRHLERAFGPDGIQALEIDAAGPTITALANDLLASCFGRRFTVKIVTTEPKARGGGHKEVFDVQLIDAERGRTGKRGSGGEQVILDEAVRLAVSIYNGRQGARCRTLWRDETAGALSPQNASRYVQMLRRARDVGGFHHVVFISHDPRVWRQADTQIYVADGRIAVGVPAEYQDALSG